MRPARQARRDQKGASIGGSQGPSSVVGMEQQLEHQQVMRQRLSKLQAHKSSFQAWKCVSLGYALLAALLLLAKWREVDTDLKLLAGLEQLLWARASNGSDPMSGAAVPQPNDSSQFQALTWPPAPLESLLLTLASQMQSGSGPNSNSNAATAAADASEALAPAAEGAEGNASASPAASLMSHHMRLLAGREFSGGQLLRQEVEAFLGESRRGGLLNGQPGRQAKRETVCSLARGESAPSF